MSSSRQDQFNRQWKARFLQAVRFLQSYYPLTVLGTAVFLLSIYLLYRALLNRNPYEFLLSLLLIAVVGVLAVSGTVQARRMNKAHAEWDLWDSTQQLTSGQEGVQRVDLRTLKPSVFYRIHIVVSGMFLLGSKSRFYHKSEIASAGGESVSFSLLFPTSGEFHAKMRYTIRDVFGFSRARFGVATARSLLVQPSIAQQLPIPSVSTQSNLSKENRRKTADEERYYMREYVPGDRSRDINWKASDRLQELITRISPLAEDETRIITIHVRNVNKYRNETLESIVHLDHMKSWLVAFIYAVHNSDQHFAFHVYTASDPTTVAVLETEEDIDDFRVHLGGLRFIQNAGTIDMDLGEGEQFIFTTPYDPARVSGLHVPAKSRVSVFTTQSATRDQETQHDVRLSNLFSPFLYKLVPAARMVALDVRTRNPGNWSGVAESVHETMVRVRL